MNLWKKIVLAPFAFAAVATSVQAVADDPMTHTIKLKTTIPTTSFYVEPETSGWINKVQVLEYTSATDTITSLSEGFKFKHNAGSITGALGNSAVLSTKKGDTIDLAVKFNDVELGLGAKEVVTVDDAGKGGTTQLVISANKPTGGYLPGAYTGNVELIFDPVLVP